MTCLILKILGLKPRRSQMRRWIAPAASSHGRRDLTGTGELRKREVLPLSRNHSKKTGPLEPGGLLLGQTKEHVGLVEILLTIMNRAWHGSEEHSFFQNIEGRQSDPL